jgi:hypothetical protein
MGLALIIIAVSASIIVAFVEKIKLLTGRS